MLTQELSKLFESQQLLDQEISSKHGISHSDVKDQQLLAFIVEVGECANETRCFKYWSLKKASEKPVILEEYVDGIHFLLSIGLHYQFDNVEMLAEKTNTTTDLSLTELFLCIFEKAVMLKRKADENVYADLFEYYFAAGRHLSFSDEDIIKGYYAKHEENYRRQANGY